MQVGPFSIEVPEPMRRTRVVLQDNKTGISCDHPVSCQNSAGSAAERCIEVHRSR